MDYVKKGLSLIVSFLSQKGYEKELDKYKDKVENYHIILRQAEAERSQLNDTDEFISHHFDKSQLKKFQEQLSDYTEIKEAYLVEKVVTYFPQEPFCILGIIRNKSLFEGKYSSERLIDLLVDELQFPSNYYHYIIVLNDHPYRSLKNKFSQVHKALIWP